MKQEEKMKEKNKLKEKMKEKMKEKELVRQTIEDFESRVRARKSFDTQWKLNMNFYMGNQFCDIGYTGGVQELDKQFFWQQREVFNHIAPIVDLRLSKLSKIKPKMHVMPSTDDEEDLYTAQMGKKILEAVSTNLNLIGKINQAIKWSEICGTSFYKVSWNSDIGQVVAIEEDGKKIKLGDVDISVCSPFEIYPDSATHENISDCESIIHARAFSVDEINQLYGVRVDGQDVNVFNLSASQSTGGLGYSGLASNFIETVKSNSAVVLEKYVRPSDDHPNGRLIIVAGDKLVYDGDLPYQNGSDGKREFPFVKQVCMEKVGSFWGASVIERLIPIQRAYNAVKNRKHEYLNRLTLGVLSVEDGSVDIDNLEEEGLAPGKILVYRQGSNAPQFLGGESLPADFEKEEQRLLDEFATLGGTSEISAIQKESSNISGVALELLIEESDNRMTFSTDSIKNAIKTAARFVLRLYKEFATLPRLLKVVGENGKLEVEYFTSSDISSDDVQFDTDNETNDTLSQRRNMIYTLLDKGLLQDEEGKISNAMKNKILQNIGFGVWENSVDLNDLHTKNADAENKSMHQNLEVKVKEIDDHELHLNQHVAYMLRSIYNGFDVDAQVEQKFLKHIQMHKAALANEKALENVNKTNLKNSD